eukprot:4182285-Pyramimonas_sp.AAC.1
MELAAVAMVHAREKRDASGWRPLPKRRLVTHVARVQRGCLHRHELGHGQHEVQEAGPAGGSERCSWAVSVASPVAISVCIF